MISAPGLWLRYREDEVTRQQVRPGTARRVWPYLRRYRGPMVLLVFMTTVDSAIAVVIPLILRLIIDDGILRHREDVIVTLALAIAGLALVGVGAGYMRAWYSNVAGHRPPAVHGPGGGPDPRHRRRADRRTRDARRATRRGRGVRQPVPDTIRAAGSITCAAS
jgi:hypothetical protein